MSIFIIAEIGINHNGELDLAKQLIQAAVDAGADAVKFQKRTLDIVYGEEELARPRENPYGTTNGDLKRHLEFGQADFDEIDRYCKEKGIAWSASAWDVPSQLFLQQYNVTFNKVASALICHEELLHTVAKEGRQTYISTGMATIDEIDRAVEIFREHDCPFALMHTVSTYPMPTKDANLRMITTLQNRYDCDVGYSGHEAGLAISTGAAALGITSLERHITLDRSMFGSDQAASVEPNGFRNLCGAVRKIQIAMGDGVKRMAPGEDEVAKKLRRCSDD